MNTVNVAARLHRQSGSHEPSPYPRQQWRVISTSLVVVIFIEAIFAGAMLSGVGWARTAHQVTAIILIASTMTAGLVSFFTLRRIPHGLKLGLTLLSLAAVVVLQASVGALSAKGANLLWIHVPLGVALVGLAGQAAATARTLGEIGKTPRDPNAVGSA